MEHITDAYGKTGVIIARFQTPTLHTGHKFLLDWVYARHETLCVILASKDIVPTDKDPLSFQVRKDMILESYPKAIVIESFDCPSDEVWSKNIDTIVSKACPKGAVLYGSRQSFIPHYSGVYEVYEVPAVQSQSGTDLRNECIKKATSSMDFRIGVIHAATERFPLVFPTVDCAVYKKEGGIFMILLGQKNEDGNYYRFIGGFVDKKDTSLEESARREVCEETGGNIEHEHPEYIMSCPLPSHRYEGTKDSIFTTFFGLKYRNGEGVGTDDLDNVCWFPLENIFDLVIPSHKQLAEKLIIFLNSKN
jgi:bifunctional NMN adenylyltransferase/nudix hydrolase